VGWRIDFKLAASTCIKTTLLTSNARLTEQILLAAFLQRSAKKVTVEFVLWSRFL
tara:strand:+ start:234 stop:398 length:165 start_codon:yes stop_codon:yes gene_type:complete